MASLHQACNLDCPFLLLRSAITMPALTKIELCLQQSQLILIIPPAATVIPAAAVQYHHKDFPPMRHRILRRHLWSHSGGQQPHWRTAEKHLWLLLCAGTAVPLDAPGPVAGHHAGGLLLGSSLWCVGEIPQNDTAACPPTAVLGSAWRLLVTVTAGCWATRYQYGRTPTLVCVRRKYAPCQHACMHTSVQRGRGLACACIAAICRELYCVVSDQQWH